MSLIWGTIGYLGGAMKTFMEGAAHPWQTFSMKDHVVFSYKNRTNQIKPKLYLLFIHLLL